MDYQTDYENIIDGNILDTLHTVIKLMRLDSVCKQDFINQSKELKHKLNEFIDLQTIAYNNFKNLEPIPDYNTDIEYDCNGDIIDLLYYLQLKMENENLHNGGI